MKRKIYGLGKGLIAMLAIMCSAQMSNAQVGIGTNVPDPSAQLQIESTSKGLLIPRVTSTDDVTLPAKSLLVYQTGGTAGFYYNSGTPASPEWVKLATGQGGVTGAAGGDLSGTFPNPSVATGAISSDKIADGTITNTDINASAAIAYSKLALTNSIVNGDITASAITTSKVADGTVTSAKIFDGTIVNADVSPAAAIAYSKLALTNAIVAGDITSGAVTPAKLNASGANAGDVLTYNGSNISWAAPSGGSSSVSDAFSASNTTSAVIAVVLGGTDVPLPDNQKLNTFTVDATDEVFTVPSTGQYRIDYRVSLTAALLVSTQVLRNGVPIAASLITPTVAKDEFNCSFLVELTAGDTLTMQLFGLLGAATLSGGSSTGITVQKL